MNITEYLKLQEILESKDKFNISEIKEIISKLKNQSTILCNTNKLKGEYYLGEINAFSIVLDLLNKLY